MAAPSASFWQTAGINWTIPYYAISVSLNFLVTVMIVARLILFRTRLNRIRAVGGHFSNQYTSIAAILIESAALYSAYVLLFLIPFGLGAKSQVAVIVSELFPQSLPPVQVSIRYIFRLIFFHRA
jgi:hypothetical protein